MEPYASPIRARPGTAGASQRLLQVLLCAGAIVAAGALTIEARITVAATGAPRHDEPIGPIRKSPPGILAARPAPAAAPVSPAAAGPGALAPIVATASAASPRNSAESQARAAAQKALAAALTHARPPKMETASFRAEPKAGPASARSPASTSKSAAARPADAPPQPAALSEAQLKSLAMKAAQALRAGDIGGARMVLERAASAGDATAVFALGETYDPNVLAKMRVRGLRGDPDKAAELYRRAAAQGVPQAQDRLQALSSSDTAVAAD